METRVIEISEDEFLSEFARVMHEWGHKPFLRGEVRLPTHSEVRLRIKHRREHDRSRAGQRAAA